MAKYHNATILGNDLTADQVQSLYGALGNTVGAIGDTIGNISEQEYIENSGRPDLAYTIYGNSWGDVFNNSDKLSQGLQTVDALKKDYSQINNNDSLENAWNPNDFQQDIKASNETGAVVGSTLADTGKLAAAGSMFGPVGTVIGAGVGLFSGLGRGIASIFQHEDNAEKLRTAIRRANEEQKLNYYSTSDNNMQRQQRNWFMHQQASGGPLYKANGVEEFNTGGTHSMNPLGGIQQGIASDGLPNRVEEGEKRYKDYIFSDRLKANKSLLEQYNLPEKYAGMSFADICDKLQKESEDRPNDPVSLQTLKDWMTRLQGAQEEHKMKLEQKRDFKVLDSMFAEGGKIHIKPENRGKFTALKERTGKSASWFKEHGTPAQKKMATFALNARKWNHADGGHLFDAGGRKNPWEVGYLYDNGFLPYDIEATTVSPWDRRYITIQNNNRATGINLPEVAITPEEEQELKANITYPTFDNNQESVNNNSNSTINLENLRYAPAVGSIFSAMQAATQPKDYRLANQLRDIASQYKPMATPSIGGYRKYNPYDVNLGDAENLALQSAALRANRGQNRATQAALNTAILNKFQEAQAKRNLTMQQANEANRLSTDTYNLGIDRENLANVRAYDQLNANINDRRLAMLSAAAQAQDASDTAWAQMYNTTFNNMFDQIGNVGIDIHNKNQMMASLLARGYDELAEIFGTDVADYIESMRKNKTKKNK